MSDVAEERNQCHACGATQAQWSARCSTCQAWSRPQKLTTTPGSQRLAPHVAREPRPADRRLRIVEQPEVRRGEADPGDPDETERPQSIPVSIMEVDVSAEHVRIRTGIQPLDDVLGGGIVVGSMILLGGEPGAGKTTLLMQTIAAAEGDGIRLYATGEESIQQVTMNARRISAATPQIAIVRETSVEGILWHAVNMKARIVVIDSIHTISSSKTSGSAGDNHQVKSCAQILMNFAKTTGISTIAISHVNGDGEVSGPKKLEHLGDVTLMFEKVFPRIKNDPHRRLYALKNRFGAETVFGSFRMSSSGLIALERGEEPAAEPETGDRFLPIAQELLYRYLELGGALDDGLRDRLSGLPVCLDAAPRGAP